MEESRNIVDESGEVVGYTLDDRGKAPTVFKYDRPIDDFLEGAARLKAIHHRNPKYLRSQLNRRIRARRIEGIRATVIKGVCYLKRKDDSAMVSVS